MKIFTSYYANSTALREAGIEMVSIALWPPRWFKGSRYSLVAPKAFMLKNHLSREEYIESYQKYVLDKLDAKEIIKNLELLTQGKDVALCCYEKPEDFCHRHLLAEWLTKETGIEIKEYIKEKPKVLKEGELFE